MHVYIASQMLNLMIQAVQLKQIIISKKSFSYYDSKILNEFIEKEISYEVPSFCYFISAFLVWVYLKQW